MPSKAGLENIRASGVEISMLPLACRYRLSTAYSAPLPSVHTLLMLKPTLQAARVALGTGAAAQQIFVSACKG